MMTEQLQRKAFDAIADALPFAVDSRKVTVEPGLSYTRSPIKAHDYAAGIMAAYGCVVERLGVLRGLPAQTMTLNRRRCGLLLNSGQMQFLNGYGTLMDTWPIGPDNGTYRTKDGRYVTIVGLHPHLRDGLLEYFQCQNSAKAIQASAEKKDAQQIEDELAALNLPCGIVRTPQEWRIHPQGEATVKRPMFDIEHSGNAHERKLGKARHRPLEGVRVIELANLVAGPTIGRLLAEQGAEVIKVQPPVADIVMALWLDVGWGKKTILLDIKSHFGKRRFAELLAGADVLVGSQRQGALDHIGFDEGSLRAINPDLVYTSVAYCAGGTPWQGRRGYEQIAQSVSGMMDANSVGLPDPTVISVLLNDYLTGYLGTIGTIAALSEREEKGGFWRVEAALSRCATMATEFLQPRDAEQYAPLTMRDMAEHGVDQPTPHGLFTRLAPAVAFSHTPSMLHLAPGLPNSHPDTTGWTETTNGAFPEIPHYSSRLAREDRLRNLISSHGIEDRGDGGGGFSLASRQLMQYVMASRA
jgi:crotonobetainyl-CoA:carnitine CoA-transferase CaiB-like acyl-CoA transferase